MAFNNNISFIYISSTAGDEITTSKFIEKIKWVCKTCTKGDNCIITDSSDNVITEFVANDTVYEKEFEVKRKLDNIKINTLDAGTVYIYTYTENS